MKARANIKEVFNLIRESGICIDLGESYCSGTQLYPPSHLQKSWIRATSENDDRMMEDINEEGSAEVSWVFGPPEKVTTIGTTIVNAFTKKGYIVEWNKRMGGKITVVIDVDDLPESFLDKWVGNKPEDDDEDDEFNNERVDPDSDVVFNKEDDEKSIFSTDEEEEDEDDEDDSGPIIDPISDEEEEEEDDDTMCPRGCNCVNCEEERECN
jgi:hypothetical protein